ncbi:hypothetical protein [Deinococcus navajonensis]|uniref:Uncharacterized protein n=1 Tax=Deinococcus navajonensis TaxID=309884 RepID=A0ABV8XQZ4_9DEIO
MNFLRSPLAGLGLLAVVGALALMIIPGTQLMAGPVLGMVLAITLLTLAAQLQASQSRTAAGLVSVCGLVSLAVCFYRLGQVLLWW